MKNLRALRIAAGKKQYEMADMMGVSRTTYLKWENSNNPVDVETLVKLSEYFNVSVDYLLDMEPRNSEDEELWELRETLRSRPDVRLLFSISKRATERKVLRAVKILEALEGDD